MVFSMTGYGFCSLKLEEVEARVEARSVNHRFLEVHIKRRESLGAEFEAFVAREVRRRFERGYFEISFWREPLSNRSTPELRVNEELLDLYAQIARALSDRGIEPKISLESALKIPGLISQEFCLGEKTGQENLRSEDFERALSAALERLKETRAREGEGLAEIVRARARASLEMLDRVEELSRGFVESRHEVLLERLSRLIESAKLDRTAIEREAALIADRADISEEIDRARSHLERVGELLKAPSPIGRKLDFYAQELFRETNTILSKSGSREISALAIELKSESEKIKEQAQNIE